MGFYVDKQTLEDLGILGKFKPQSIVNLYAHTHTRGGERLMDSMFQHPLSDAAQINRRAGIFGFFSRAGVEFPLDDALFETTEHYLSNSGRTTAVTTYLHTFRRKFMQLAASDKEYGLIEQGIAATCELFGRMRDFVEELQASEGAAVYGDKLGEIHEILAGKSFTWTSSVKDGEKLPLLGIARYDNILRSQCSAQMKRLLEFIYEIDVMTSVGKIARERGFVAAKALDYGAGILDIRGFRHPQLTGAVANDIRIDRNENVFFLTGANMAGKSTLMKSVGISVYLAHMGFPVSAGSMEFSVLDGLFTSINVSDNLNMGYSHFYAEVLRVKSVAVAVSESKNLLVIFDELFKGTNVKDAYDATVAVTEAFSHHRNCAFIISTHITEAGDALIARCANMRCQYLPTIMEGSRPKYTYTLTPGITADRHGMMIINNERIVETIRNVR